MLPLLVHLVVLIDTFLSIKALKEGLPVRL